MNRIIFGNLLFVLNVYGELLTIRQTINGPVEGIIETSILGQKYEAFKGIPFAEPPITGIDPYTGEIVDRRFKAPEPLKRNWTEAIKAHNFSKRCLTTSTLELLSSENDEDCLYLNVYVPVEGRERKTVLIYIHGGAFARGNSRHGPDFLLSEDNVVVVIQYRLGPFGFLNLNFGEYTGNMGLKDQQLAIKWVYENIEHFAGNKNEILLFGRSAGGISVHFHMLNGESRKYFTRAFIVSATAFGDYILSEEINGNKMQECAEINDTMQLIEHLKTANGTILAKCNPFTGDLKLPWVPTIESPKTIDAFITATPDKMYSAKKAPPMDAMFTFVSEEFLYFSTLAPSYQSVNYTDPILNEDWRENTIPLPIKRLTKNDHPNEYIESSELLRKLYLSDTTNATMNKINNMKLLSDMHFVYGIIKSVIFQTNANIDHTNIDKRNETNVFLFRFSMNSDLNIYKSLLNVTYEGATHGDEACYILCCKELDEDGTYANHINNKDKIYRRIMQMIKMITNFARTGNPSVEGDTSFKSCKSETEIFCKEISNEEKSSVTTNIKEEIHYNVWRDVEEMYYKSIKASVTTAQEHKMTIDLNILFYSLISLLILIIAIIIIIIIIIMKRQRKYLLYKSSVITQ